MSGHDTLQDEHSAAWDHGVKVGQKDAARYVLQGADYTGDTNAPSRLTGRPLDAWYAGWMVGNTAE